MYSSIELYKEPLGIKNTIVENTNELTSKFDQEFLCGLIKEYKPKKIVEVGVAGGGTSAIILNCIKCLGYNAELYSVDLAVDSWVNDRKRPVGFMGIEAARDLKLEDKYHLICGKTISECIYEIGENIELLFLDTSHFLPGELLDFVCCYPFLSQNAIVALHDVSLNTDFLADFDSYATKILFDVVKARKILNKNKDRYMEYPNIAAFQITKETKESILDCVSALTISWNYVPSDNQLDACRKIITKYYDDETIDLFEKTVAFAKKRDRWTNDEGYVKAELIKKFEWLISTKKRIFVYGTSVIGQKIMTYLQEKKANIGGYIVSNNYEKTSVDNKFKVYYLDELSLNKDDLVIFAMSAYNQNIVKQETNISSIATVYPTSPNSRYDGYDAILEYISIYLNFHDLGEK